MSEIGSRMTPTPTLETPRLLLRPLELADAAQLQAPLPPMGNRSLSLRPGPLALSLRRRPPLHPRHGAALHRARRNLAMDSPPEIQPRSNHRQHRPAYERERQSRLLARPPLATPGPDDRSLRSRHRFLVQYAPLSRSSRSQSRRQHRLPSHFRKARHAPDRH